MIRRLDPQLKNRFGRLLLTWTIHRAKDPKLIPDSEFRFFPGDIEETSRRLERKYGDGHYEDRRFLLEVTLKAISERADLEKVFDVLSRARHLARRSQANRVGARYSQRREAVLVRRNLRHWIGRALGLFAVNVDFLDDVIDGGVRNPTFDALRALDAALVKEPELGPRINSLRLRRSKAGRPSNRWLAPTHRLLSAAGVSSKELRNDLLMAVGLIPYKTP